MYIKRILLIIVLAGIVAAGVFSYFIYKTVFLPNTAFENDSAYIFVSNESTYGEVKVQLQPLLKDIESFDKVAQKKGYAQNVKPGKYQINKGMNNNEIVNSLRSNNLPVKVSFNNQETLERLAGRISEQIDADSLSLLSSFKDNSYLETNGFNSETALAMYIPNTYEFYWNTTAESFRDRMLIEFKNFWNQDRQAKAEKLNLTPLEVINLAAIVQKETAMADERPRVAGVYLNRLRVGMFLQADPTVIYAIKKETGNFDTVIKRVLFKDLEINSPYNTYKYPGIPPGPISMPDLSSIDAVLNPEQHDYYYFVADVSKPGYHMFAKSLAQHNRNRQQYINWINKTGINR